MFLHTDSRSSFFLDQHQNHRMYEKCSFYDFEKLARKTSTLHQSIQTRKYKWRLVWQFSSYWRQWFKILSLSLSFSTKRISTFIVIDMKTEFINESLFIRNKKLSRVFSIYIAFQKLSILIRVCVHHMSNFRSASCVFWTIIIMIFLTEMLIIFHQQMFFEVTVEYVLRS